jgi:CRISPR-associated protein Cmr6
MEQVNNLKLKSYNAKYKTATFDFNRKEVVANEVALTGGKYDIQSYEFQRNLLVFRDFSGTIFEKNGKWIAQSVEVMPTETREAPNYENFAILLNKPPKIVENSETKAVLFSIPQKDESTSPDSKKPFEIIKLTERFKPGGDLNNFHFDEQFIAKIHTRQSCNLADLLEAEQRMEPLDFVPDWRVVVGLGEASIYETNITLHHIYGIPYIPASAIKGILHHYAKEQLGERDTLVQDIFGAGDQATNNKLPQKGKIVIFDAFPIHAPRIECDVMTPHYSDYYMSEEVWPADWLTPIPIPFLTVGKGTPFRFNIGIKGNQTEKLISIIKSWLIDALSTKGIGAKTAVGYGFLNLNTKTK